MVEESRSLSIEEQRHIFEHRCVMLTTPPWDGCTEEACPGDRDMGSDTWCQMVNDPEKKSLCWTCPVMKEMYPNLGKCSEQVGYAHSCPDCGIEFSCTRDDCSHEHDLCKVCIEIEEQRGESFE